MAKPKARAKKKKPVAKKPVANKPVANKPVANKKPGVRRPKPVGRTRLAPRTAKPVRKKRTPARTKPVARKAKAVAKKNSAETKQKPAPKKRQATRKKPVARKAKALAKKRPATTRPKPPAKRARPRSTPAPAPARVVPDWRGALRAEVATTGDDFAAYLRSLGATGWEHADTPELAGLEQWGTMLARADRSAGIGALVRVAQHGFQIAVAAGGIGLEGMGFHAAEPAVDGAPVETQIELAARWLDAPDEAHLAAVAAGNDPSRQLQMWDDDLRPSDDRAHWWYLDVGQCCGHAITRTAGDPRKHSYYDWPPETCVGRGLVVAVRGLRVPRADLSAILADVRAAMVA